MITLGQRQAAAREAAWGSDAHLGHKDKHVNGSYRPRVRGGFSVSFCGAVCSLGVQESSPVGVYF